ncbi:MAG: TatD family hydrolase, partial [candidate division KSB1 bacterium]|nr:TatD family hydrolase [candidate division KSB1 bacterium]
MLIDTHAHLDYDRYDGDRQEVIRRAVAEGVAAIITVGVDHRSSLAAVRLAEQYPQLYAAVGVHPHDAASMSDEQFEELTELINHPRVVAVGEVGLDYHYNYSAPEVQRRVFRRFIDLALRTEKPLIIHTREAADDTRSLLHERKRHGWRGVFHCFSGDESEAELVLEMGFHISFTGVVTFRNARAAQVARRVPLDRLLVETDCPYLTPEPFRGKRNEPAFVVYVARKMAELKGVPFDTLADLT